MVTKTKKKKSIAKPKIQNKGKWVYNFEDTPKLDKQSLKNLLGGKGANLSEMIRINLPVPPGFTITTEACNEFYKLNQNYPSTLKNQVNDAIKKVEQKN
jgi:pyruvate,orthophosphate dikinase